MKGYELLVTSFDYYGQPSTLCFFVNLSSTNWKDVRNVHVSTYNTLLLPASAFCFQPLLSASSLGFLLPGSAFSLGFLSLSVISPDITLC